MPSLDFKGKQFVYTHHLTVPFRELVVDAKKSLPAAKGKPSMDDNLIIHGDNLHALKALLPRYAGKVKCIYIDPPYNTGNEGWCYNDNVRSPLMQEWVKNGNPVEREDMERHDKWLSMMWPRLQLLRELMSDDGVIFVSIDDNEVHNLRLLMDDIFGPESFIACIVAQLNPRGRTLDRFLAKTYEYVLLYGRNTDNDSSINILEKEGELLNAYNKQDDRGIYRELELRNRNPVFNRSNRPNLFYPIYVDPRTSKVSLERKRPFEVEVYPRNSSNVDGCWTWGKAKAGSHISELVGKQVSTGAWRIYRKDYLEKVGGETATTKAKALWLEKEINNEKGKEVCNEIFGTCPFDFPKSVDLIKKCIKLGTAKDSIILDSFAGSGTTAPAVLAVNKEDGGNRKSILIECEDYANKVTAERVRRVIKGVRSASDETLKQGLGGSFTYCDLGQEINVETLLKSGKLPDFDALARYVFYTATGQTLGKVLKPGKDFYLGETDAYRVHLVYKPDREFLRSGASALNSELVERIAAGNKTKKKALVFATAKFMGQRDLSEKRIEFAQLPYAIYRVIGD
jgi:adenine-specific DNA-methyltransferase